MRELYLLAVGVMAGVVLVDFMERLERRAAYRAAHIAEETLALRSRHRNPDPEPVPEPSATPA